jgi:hypothetical protein
MFATVQKPKNCQVLLKNPPFLAVKPDLSGHNYLKKMP